MYKYFIIVGFLGIVCVSTSVAHAAPQYSVLPLVIDESLEAHDIINREITLTNTGSEPVTLYPSINNISVEEGGGVQEFLAPVESDRTTSLTAWVEMPRSGIDLKPGEVRTLPITVRIPGNAEPGEYHAFIGFGHGRNRAEAEAQVRNGRAPGTVTSIVIEDKTFSFLKIAGFVIDRFVTHADNQAAVYTFQNPGDEPLTPKGEIIIYDSSGKEVSTIPVNAEEISVPPGGEHVFSASVPISGLFGKYKALLSVEYGGAQRGSVQDIGFFYALPLHVLIWVVGGFLILVAFAAWYTHRKYLDDEEEESDTLMVHVRETKSDPVHHDLHISRP